MRTPTFASSFLGQFSDPLFVALQVHNLGPCGASHASIYVLRFGFFLWVGATLSEGLRVSGI